MWITTAETALSLASEVDFGSVRVSCQYANFLARKSPERCPGRQTTITTDFRALESIRDTKRKLMPCLEVHSGQDVAGDLSDTQVDGQPRGLHPPTVKR